MILVSLPRWRCVFQPHSVKVYLFLTPKAKNNPSKHDKLAEQYNAHHQLYWEIIWNEVAQSKAIRRTELEISWLSLDSSAMRNPLLSEALLLSFNVIFNLPTNILPCFLKKFFRSPHFIPSQSLYPVRSPLSAVRGQ